MSTRVFLCSAVLPALLLVSAAAFAQPAYSGPPGAEVYKKAQQLEAAGNKAAAAAAYQQAYQAYMSVDDSDGMIKALAKKNALAGAAAAPRPTAASPAPAARTAAMAAPRPAAAGPAPVQPVAGAVNGGRPVGLFFMTRYWIATRSLEKSTYYFAPNGQVYVDPKGFSAAELAALPASSRGSYSVVGNKLSVRWASGQTSSSEVEPQATTFSWDMGIFLAGKPFQSPSQLAGSFEGGNSISTSSGSASAVSSLTFRPDGTYSGGGASSFGGRNEAGAKTYSAGSTSSNSGRWSLSGWLLTLTDAQGRTTRGVAFPVERNDKTGQVTRFYFDNVAYKRL
ncbi:hypothetical protein [Hymenobacter properus]|uniref:Tetratricopeptide repeat protein n=1 Tax=Hymenobacter properus TaxID=2791026 RepID=A0A931FLA2_9BACT|nr:hypothetical protein [Hymenobacter properus]MBF9140504.1 hypothetical protein [Hymenobacter properus]MBR7719311.1 hypothetical protein [Microvirga sp. SRT04]